MKKLSVIVLVIVSLSFAAFAEAAKPRKRTKNANRIGPYGAMLLGQARYVEDQSGLEQTLIDFFANRSDPTQNITASSKTEDLGLQLTFGFRFNRYFAAELGLVQLGELSSTVRGEVDQGNGFVPLNLHYTFNVGGPMISLIGFVPLGEKAEFYARAGYLFSSSEREISARLDGERAGSNAARGDSQDPVFGAGFAYHFNQVYSLRAEYQKLSDVGQEERTGAEDLNIIGLAFLMRF